jgi:trehalose synthase
MGRQGKEHVREHYLIPRQLRDDLKLFARLLGM